MSTKNKKRPANSPSGNISKEMKNATASAPSTLSSVGTQESSSPVQIPMSFAAATTAGLSLSTTTTSSASGSIITTTTNTSTSQDYRYAIDRSVFKTPEPEGGFRDEIIVGIDTLDDEPYKGTITVREAVREIFLGTMEFSKEALASVSIGYNKGRIVTFKLVDKFDIDQLASIEEFTFVRQGQKKDGTIFDQKLGCKIRGIRKPNSRPMQDNTENQTRWVKIEGCEYRVEKDELLTWMNYLGDTISEITEDRVNLDDESGSDEENPGFSVGTGIYSVKMRITRDLPQFVPICGKRIRLYYRDIPKICTQCFGRHPRKGCVMDKVPWVKYVSDFMNKYAYIPKESYGKWGKIVDEWRVKNDPTEPDAETSTENVTSKLPETGIPSNSNGVTTEIEAETETEIGAGLPRANSRGAIQANPGPAGMEVTIGQDPVGQALRKLRTLGINTSAVTLLKTSTEVNSTKTTRTSAAASSRGRKNSI